MPPLISSLLNVPLAAELVCAILETTGQGGSRRNGEAGPRRPVDHTARSERTTVSSISRSAGQPYATVRETHTSVVALAGKRKHKLKKPLDLGFLDNRTRAARERACHREVELNRRLAPDVYLGVADVVGPDGRVCEHLVEMVRLPDDRRLAALIERSEDVTDAVTAVARQVAALHAASEPGPEIDRCATREALTRL